MCVSFFFCNFVPKLNDMEKFRKKILICFLLLGVMTMSAAYTPQSVPNPKQKGQEQYVANPDTLLNDSDVVFLNRCALRLEEATHAELCVVALRSIGDEDAFDFSYELFQTWGIGRQGQNTGILILFVLDSHDIRIMTGTGIEGVLTDARCSQIIREDMTPAFREGDYGGGLCLGALRIYEICTDGVAPEELLNMKSVTNRGKYSSVDDDSNAWMWSLGVVAAIIALCVFITRWAETRRCPKCNRRSASPTKVKVLKAATYSSEGQGERTYKCKHCGEEFVLPYVIPKLTHTSSGSSGHSSYGGHSHSSGGSWGGGSTSGGGAGGKW